MRRLRLAVLAATAATSLLIAVPSSANAAVGEFTYRVNGTLTGLTDPPSGECIDLPGTSDTVAANRPRNLTLSTATVFLDSSCEGDTYYVMNPGKIINTGNLVIRSVVFS